MPGFSLGVRENSAVRMRKMVRPICPNSKRIPSVIDGKLRMVENPEPNCQLAGGRWWIECEKKGHDPYHSNKTWTTTEPKFELVDGRKIKTGEDVILHEQSEPNFAQVAIGIRYSSGQGLRNAINRKGFKTLPDAGYKEVCEYRNCHRPVESGFRSKRFGNYCSAAHLELIAADQQGILLNAVNTGLEGPDAEKINMKRQRQLREAAAFAVDG